MTRHCFFGFLALLSCLLFEVSSRPSNNDESTTLRLDFEAKDLQSYKNDENSSPPPQQDITENYDETTKYILEQIKAINEALKKPHRRQQFNWNTPVQTGGGHNNVLDREILEKLQQIIASGKLHDLSDIQNPQDNYSNFNDVIRDSRQMNILPTRNPAMPAVPMPYLVNLPVLIMPNNFYERYPTNNDLSAFDIGSYQTRQSPPSSPFQFQWPFASFFPLLIRDPLLSLLNGGGLSNFIEYGQNADVCSRKQKSVDNLNNEENLLENVKSEYNDNFAIDPVINNYNSREGRALKKRTLSQELVGQEIDNTKSVKKTFSSKPAPTRKPIKQTYITAQNIKTTTDDGDLRFPFGDFTWFGNRKPVAPSPGFFINKLKVRRGGVAIAGPGGVATAGKGGAAIVGPGGLAYTQPGGLAIAGPAARVVALSSDINLSSIVSRLQEQSAINGSVPNLLQAIPEGKVVATDTTESGETPNDIVANGTLDRIEIPTNTNTMPTAHAISSKGTVVANPISQVVIARNKTASIVHTPVAAAIVGPGGVAHAQATIQYLPFYGGAKGQYLEIKKNKLGNVTGEKIVSEDKISSEVIKNSDENLLAKLLAANLQSLRTVTGNLLKLHNLGRKTGYLGNLEKVRFRTQLSSLAEAASNSIKLIEDIGDNVDVLFKKNATVRRYGQPDRDEDDDDVGEEGIGVDAPSSSFEDDEDDIGGFDDTIAEAKPIGLAVIGEHGLAASRPIGTAVAASGVAISRPIATAIAGIDPQTLGLNFQISQFTKH